MLSCRNHGSTSGAAAAAVDADLASEVALGRMAGPFDSPPSPFFRTSPLGTVPKSDGRIRVIHDLSWPRSGGSVNDECTALECKLSSFDDAARLVVAAGRGALLAKVDIASAYRCIPIRAADQPLLGCHWRGRFYFHRALPFGLGPSAALFERYSSLTHWVLAMVFGLCAIAHFLDDFFMVCGSDAARARGLLAVLLGVFRLLGWPIAAQKVKGPCTSLDYLGIVVDTVTMTASLSAARLARLRATAAAWLARDSCTRRELESLVGTLSFAAKVVRPGRAFLRRLFNLLRRHRDSQRRFALDRGSRADLRWWHAFAAAWNGVSLLYEATWSDARTALHLQTDACPSGAGAVCGSTWLSHAWTADELVACSEPRTADGRLAAVAAAIAARAPHTAGMRACFPRIAFARRSRALRQSAHAVCVDMNPRIAFARRPRALRQCVSTAVALAPAGRRVRVRRSLRLPLRRRHTRTHRAARSFPRCCH